MSLLSKFKEYGVRKFSSALFKGPIKDAFSIYPIHDSVNWLPEFVNIKEPNLNILSENIILHFIKSFADVAYSYATQSKVTSQRQEMMILLIIRSDDTLKSSLYKLFIS